VHQQLKSVQKLNTVSVRINDFTIYYYKLGDVVAQFVGALRYKLVVHRFGFLMVPLEFFINIILLAALWCWG